ncbi:MAG: YgfZ/GcvT domain-containing protein [Gammaproteobacteria bacterium]
MTLDEMRILRIAGDDRVEFLQGQLTQDVGKVDPEHAALAGWSNPKGRLLAVGQLLATPDALLWPLPADVIDGVRRRLGMFVLRANVTIDVADDEVCGLIGVDVDQVTTIGDIDVGAKPGATAAAKGVIATRLLGDPGRALLCAPAARLRELRERGGFGATDENTWRLRDIRAGLPTIIAATSEAFIPQMVNLDLLGGISFTKGCYVGQEIVARTQNLGRIKRRMHRFRAQTGDAPLPGESIHGPDGATGKIVATARADDGTELTAVVAIDRAAGPWFADTAGTAPLAPLTLPYAIGDTR